MLRYHFHFHMCGFGLSWVSESFGPRVFFPGKLIVSWIVLFDFENHIQYQYFWCTSPCLIGSTTTALFHCDIWRPMCKPGTSVPYPPRGIVPPWPRFIVIYTWICRSPCRFGEGRLMARAGARCETRCDQENSTRQMSENLEQVFELCTVYHVSMHL